MHLDLTDDEVRLLVTNTGNHIGFLAAQITRADEYGRPVPDEKRARLAAILAVEASLCRQSRLTPVRPPKPLHPTPPARPKRPTCRDKLSVLLREAPMSIADIRETLRCSDKHARNLLKALGAELDHVGPHQARYWRL